MPANSGPTLVDAEPARFKRRRSNSVQNPVTRPSPHRSRSHTTDTDLVSPQLVHFTNSAPIPSLPPPRPHRNPARIPGSVLETHPTSKQPLIVNTVFPRVQRTGPQEEITPWELEPFPPEVKSHHAELAPVPSASTQQDTSHAPGSTLSSLVRRRKSTGGRMFRPKSTTPVRAAPGKPLWNSIAPQPIRSTKEPVQSITNLPTNASSSTATLQPPKAHAHDSPSLTSPSNSATRNTDRAPFAFASATSKPLSPPQHFNSDNQLLSQRQQHLSPQNASQSSPAGPAFSTADRTILAELKRSLIAHDAQFKQKSGQKHHPFSRKEVPYPCSYERPILDWDVWETMFCQQLCGSLTWHVFETHPGRVLDLGCGAGTWVLDCARAWRECTFVGIDVVPLHPDLMRVGSDLAPRITWLQANFLDGLPFPNEEFDYVHVKRIARGVPEDKWDFLLEEIVRVMKPGAAFEMIEEDLFFPGQPGSDAEDSDEEESDDALYDSSDARQSMSSEGDSSAGRNRPSLEPPPSLTSAASSPSTISPSMPPSTITEVDEEPSPTQWMDSPAAHRDTSPQQSPVLARAVATDTSGVPVPPTMTPLSQKENSVLKKGGSPRPSASASRLGAGGATSQSLISPSMSSLGLHREVKAPPIAAARQAMGAALAVTAMGPFMGVSSPQFTSLSFSSPKPEPVIPAPTIPSNLPLLKTMPKPPINPRDHSLLKKIYSEMHSARFINLTPLSILASSLSGYLKGLSAVQPSAELLSDFATGIRTHPPLQFHFPPKPGSIQRNDLPAHSSRAAGGGMEGPDILPPALSRNRHPSNKDLRLANGSPNDSAAPAPVASVDDMGSGGHILSMKNLLQHASPYVTLDGSRMSGFAPAARPLLSPRVPGVDKERTLPPPALPRHSDTLPGYTPNVAHHTNHVLTRSQLPNETIRFDIRTLNLHLALRAAEVVACSEAMWEWVLEFQQQRKEKRLAENKVAARRSRSASLIGQGDASGKPHRSTAPKSISEQRLDEIEQLARSDFEELLFNFKFDMRDQTMLGNVLTDRFGWNNLPNATASADREIFDKACEKWDEDVAMRRELKQQERMSRQPYLHGAPVNSSSSTVGAMRSSPSMQRTQSPGGLAQVDPSDIGASRLQTSSSGDQPPAEPRGLKKERPRLSRAMRVFVAWKEE